MRLIIDLLACIIVASAAVNRLIPHVRVWYLIRCRKAREQRVVDRVVAKSCGTVLLMCLVTCLSADPPVRYLADAPGVSALSHEMLVVYTREAAERAETAVLQWKP